MEQDSNQSNNPDEEMEDIEVWDFSLDAEEIDEMVQKLNQLKITKTNFSFDIDEDNELLIHHADEKSSETSGVGDNPK